VRVVVITADLFVKHVHLVGDGLDVHQGFCLPVFEAINWVLLERLEPLRDEFLVLLEGGQLKSLVGIGEIDQNVIKMILHDLVEHTVFVCSGGSIASDVEHHVTNTECSSRGVSNEWEIILGVELDITLVNHKHGVTQLSVDINPIVVLILGFLELLDDSPGDIIVQILQEFEIIHEPTELMVEDFFFESRWQFIDHRIFFNS